MLKKKIMCVFLMGSLLSTSACSTLPTAADFKPRQEPVYNMTQSSRLLECVGSKVAGTAGPGIDVFVSDILDHTTASIETGFLTKNAVMMMTTAIDRLGTDRVQVVGRNGGLNGRRQVQILGAFTELNRTTASDALSGDISLPGGIGFSLGNDKNYNQIALDVAMSESNRIVPHTGTSVSVQIFGQSGDVTVTYDEGSDFAASVGAGFSAQEGFHAAQRLLVETTVAMMISKFYRVDMTQCLQHTAKKDVEPQKMVYDKPIFTPASVAASTTVKPRIMNTPAVSRKVTADDQYYGGVNGYSGRADVNQALDVTVLRNGRVVPGTPDELKNRPQDTGYSGITRTEPATGFYDKQSKRPVWGQ